MTAKRVSTCKMNRSASSMISINCLPFTARSMSPINAAELSSYPDSTCQICWTLTSIASCLSLSSSGVNSVPADGLGTAELAE